MVIINPFPVLSLQVSLDRGERIYQSVSFEGGKMVKGPYSCVEKKQRVHHVDVRDDRVFVMLNVEEEEGLYTSDEYAFNETAAENLSESGRGPDGKPLKRYQIHSRK